MRIGEGPALVAEELVFEKGVRQRGAVDRDEGKSGSGAEVVERPRRELFPRARLSRNEDRGLGFGKTAELVAHVHERRRIADQLVQDLRATRPLHAVVDSHRRAVFRHGFSGRTPAAIRTGVWLSTRGTAILPESPSDRIRKSRGAAFALPEPCEACCANRWRP